MHRVLDRHRFVDIYEHDNDNHYDYPDTERRAVPGELRRLRRQLPVRNLHMCVRQRLGELILLPGYGERVADVLRNAVVLHVRLPGIDCDHHYDYDHDCSGRHAYDIDHDNYVYHFYNHDDDNHAPELRRLVRLFGASERMQVRHSDMLVGQVLLLVKEQLLRGPGRVCGLVLRDYDNYNAD
jgi:hypothetical protein